MSYQELSEKNNSNQTDSLTPADCMTNTLPGLEAAIDEEN